MWWSFKAPPRKREVLAMFTTVDYTISEYFEATRDTLGILDATRIELKVLRLYISAMNGNRKARYRLNEWLFARNIEPINGHEYNFKRWYRMIKHINNEYSNYIFD